MFGPYSPATLFAPTSSIGRRQYLVSFFYQALVVACSVQFQVMTNGNSPVMAFMFGVMAFITGIAAFVMMALAIKGRLADCGMSPWWLGIPCCFLALEMLRSVTGSPAAFVLEATSLFSLAGLVFLTKTSVVALLLLLMMVPGMPDRRAAGALS